MHDVITVGNEKQKTYQGTVNFCAWSCIFCICISTYFGFNNNLVGSLFPLPFFMISVWGYYLFKRLSQNLVFDYINGIYHHGQISNHHQKKPKGQGDIREIQCLIISRKRNSGHYDEDTNTSSEDYDSYRLEMELLNGTKKVIMHRARSGKPVYATAAHLAQRIGIPAYDADGLLNTSDHDLVKQTTTKSSRINIDDQEKYKDKKNWFATILIATLLAGGWHISYNKNETNDEVKPETVVKAPHVSETLHPQVLENQIKKFYATRLGRNYVMTSIDKIAILPIDEKYFEMHVRYQFAPSRPGVGYVGSDQRTFKVRINSYDANSASISILSMGQHNSANFAVAELKKVLK